MSDFFENKNTCNNPLKVDSDSLSIEKVYKNRNPVLKYRKQYSFQNIWIDKENRSYWLNYTCVSGGKLTFILKSIKKNEDWDFTVYRYSKNICKQIKNIKPLRTNFSRSSVTGLSFNSKYNYVSYGVRDAFSKFLKVEENDQFLILINSPNNSDKGFTIDFRLHEKEEEYKKKYQSGITEIQEINKVEKIKVFHIVDSFLESKINPKKKITITVFFKDKKEAVISNTDLLVVRKKDLLEAKKLDVVISAEGYEIKKKTISIIKRDSFRIKLNKLKDSYCLSISEIYFKSKSDMILKKSIPFIEIVADYLKKNTELNCIVEGHVNGESRFNKKSYKILSENRAKRVYDELINKFGIIEDRLSYNGVGNSRMIFRNPKSEKERIKNRRVTFNFHKK